MAFFRPSSRYLSTEFRRINEAFRLQRVDKSSTEFKALPLTPSNKAALDHFDRFYTQAYGPSSWSVMRVALLTPPFKVAVLNRCCSRFDEIATLGVGSLRFDLIELLQKSHCASQITDEHLATCEIPADDPSPGLEETTTDEPNLSRQYLLRTRDLTVGEMTSLSEFVPVTELVSESEIFTRSCDDDYTYSTNGNTDGTSDSEIPIDIVREEWRLPEALRVKCPGRGRINDFVRPQLFNGQFDFYPMDLGSLVAVLALNLNSGDTLLDLCAAPGGKSVAALQTLQLRRLVCVDNSSTRLLRLRHVLSTHGRLVENSEPMVHVIHESNFSSFLRFELSEEDRLFTKVLVDVPCSADRHALTSLEGSIFSKGKSKLRGSLPECQLELLRRGMELCSPGGSVVYSTCTLSPAQNQAVIETCLTKRNMQSTFVPVDLTPLFHMFTTVQPELGISILPVHVNWLTSGPIGLLVVPRISANYGPTFVAKLRRVS